MGKKNRGKKHQSNYENQLCKKVKSNEWNKSKKDNKDIFVTQFENYIFKSFYQMQILQPYFGGDQKEFEEFWASLSQPLPISFRFNPTQMHYQSVINRLQDGSLVKELVQEIEQEKNNEQQMVDQQEVEQQQKNPLQLDKLIQKISWYPESLVWESKLGKKNLRKSQSLVKLHQFIQKCNASGLLTRQELVSMLPPLFLDPQPGEFVLDMCAAPGSKTCQLVEMMQYQAMKKQLNVHELGGGCIIANDVDQKRAYMLSHQLQRLPTASVIVTNHPAQFFPSIKNDKNEVILFDKVLCDVPCTGDGAARKLPSRWVKWSSRDGNVIHPLQLSILMRALSICKVGGSVMYSTCSLNPIEDEAVIAEVFRRANSDAFELVDIHTLPDFKSRRGLNNWKVLITDDFLYKEHLQTISDQEQKQQEQLNELEIKQQEFFKSLQNDDFMYEIKDLESPPQVKKVYGRYSRKQEAGLMNHFKSLRPSLFPMDQAKMDQIGIQKTMRVLPHDQDSGGFYLAMFRKKAPIIWAKPMYDEKILGYESYQIQIVGGGIAKIPRKSIERL